MSAIGEFVPLQAPAKPLGRCEWCWEADAVRRVEVTPAKRKPAGQPLKLSEQAVVVPACEDCAARVERQKAAAAEAKERQAEEKARARRARTGTR